MEFYFYILYSSKIDMYYVGYTGEDLNSRIRKHNSNHKGFTGKTDDWELIFYENYPTRTSAYARERQVKSWKSRAAIHRLIKSKPL